jgi:nitrate/nitrite transport system permease protein
MEIKMTTATLARGLEALRRGDGLRLPERHPAARDGAATEAPVAASPAPGPVVDRPSVGEYFGNFMRAVLPPLIGLALVVGLWALVAMKSSDFPGPSKTLDAAVVLFSDPFYSNGPNDQG